MNSRPRNGDERRSLALQAVRESTSHWGLYLYHFHTAMLSLAGEPADEDTEDKENEMPVDSKEKKRKRVNTFRS